MTSPLDKCLPPALFVLFVLSPPCRATARDDATPAPIGVAKIDITPETPVRMYGYAARQTESTGVAGALSAKALAIGSDDGQGPAVMLCVDCGAVPAHIRQTVYQRVNSRQPVSAERFVLCNSHCHSGPDLDGLDSMEEEQRQHLVAYANQLTDRLVQVVEQALANRQPARLELARGTVGFAANRRVLTDGKWSGFGAVPDAPVDHQLSVLRAVGKEGRTLAILINYACHNTTLRGDFQQIHGDWAGCAQQFVEADQPGATALITIGCGADSDPCPHGTVELCAQHGRELAGEVQRLLAAGPWTPIDPSISTCRRTVEIPWAQNPDLDAARQAARNSYTVSAALRKIDRGMSLVEPFPYPITTWTFGDDLAMVFLSHEVVVDYAIRLKQEFDPGRLWINAYAHEVGMYIVSPRLLEEEGYEANNSLSAMVTLGQPKLLDPPLLERIVSAVREMLPETFRKP